MTKEEFVARKFADAFEAFLVEKGQNSSALTYDELQPWQREVADSMAKKLIAAWPEITAGIPNAAETEAQAQPQSQS